MSPGASSFVEVGWITIITVIRARYLPPVLGYLDHPRRTGGREAHTWGMCIAADATVMGVLISRIVELPMKASGSKVCAMVKGLSVVDLTVLLGTKVASLEG